MYVAATGGKDDVTQQALHAARAHVNHGCTDPDCACQFLEVREQCGKIYPAPVPGEVVKTCILAPRHEGNHSDFSVDWTFSEAAEVGG